MAVTLVGGALDVGTAPARADEVDDLKRQAAAVADQIEKVGEELDFVAEDYVVAVDEARQLDLDLVKSTAEVDGLRIELDDVRVALREFAVKTFASGGQGGGLGGLLGGTRELADTVVKQQYTELALNSGQETSDELESKVAQLRVAEKRLQRQRDRKDELVASLDTKRQAAEEKERELLALQGQTDVDLAQALVEEQQRREAEAARQAEVDFERIKAEAKREAENNRSSGGSNSGSGSTTKPKGDSGSGGRGGGGSSGGSGGGGSGGGGSGGGDTGGSGSGGGGSGGGDTGGGGSGGGDTGGGGSGGGDTGGGGSGGGDTGGGGSGGGGGDVPPPSPGASGAIAAAKSQLGVPYRFAAEVPNVAFDCSGLTKWAWGRAGVGMPHQSRAQFASFPQVPIAEAQPGDLLFFRSPISHVALYIGGGLLIHAVQPGTLVSIAAVRWGNVVGVVRPG